jgi:ABC-2 type transport system ATP-binding protein
VGSDGFDALRDSVRRLDEGRIWVADIALHRPTLDDVFLSLTGRGAEEGTPDGDPEAQPSRRKRRRK